MTLPIKKVIVNGSINPSFTHEEFAEMALDKSSALDACWNIIVHMTSSYNSPTTFNWVDAPSHRQLEQMLFESKDKTQVEVACNVFKCYMAFKNEHKKHLHAQGIIKGEVLGDALSKFCPQGGELLVTTGELIGLTQTFISSFNHFNSATLSSIADKIKELNIINNYGENNPNTGEACTFWNISLGRRDTIELVFTTKGSGITKLTEKEINKKEIHIRTLLSQTNTDFIKRKNHYWPNGSGKETIEKIHSIVFSMGWD
jgi:hypothetical protein